MSNQKKSEEIAKEYSAKANEAMDKVTDDQNKNIKDKVENVRDAVLDEDVDKNAVK